MSFSQVAVAEEPKKSEKKSSAPSNISKPLVPEHSRQTKPKVSGKT